MICQECQKGDHCMRHGTFCTCQHRGPDGKKPKPEELKVDQLTSFTTTVVHPVTGGNSNGHNRP